MIRSKRIRKKVEIYDGRTKHALSRARLRYNLELSESDLARIRTLIHQGMSTSVRRYSNTRSVHDVPFRDQIVRVIYSNATHQIITFLLPEDDLDNLESQTE